MSVGQCMNCKHFAQGKMCSFCANERQTNPDLKEYTYWPFGCNLHEEGVHQSRIDYMNKIKNESASNRLVRKRY